MTMIGDLIATFAASIQNRYGKINELYNNNDDNSYI